VKLDTYTLVLLRRPANAPELPEEELERLQAGHLAFHARMRAGGHVVMNGPFTGQPDPSLRGMTIYRTPVEEARRLAAQDPSVKAGRLVVDVFTWMTQRGALGDRPASTIELD
jgi:uncharacterized protein YciI